jgi:hypothetical protein
LEAGDYTVTVSATGYNSKTSDPVTVTIPTGPLPLVLYFDDAGNAAFTVDTAIVLSKTGATQNQPIALSGDWSSQAWYVDAVRTAKGTDTSFTLNVENYTVGPHHLTVRVNDGSAYWSKTITFTVTE